MNRIIVVSIALICSIAGALGQDYEDGIKKQVIFATQKLMKMSWHEKLEVIKYFKGDFRKDCSDMRSQGLCLYIGEAQMGDLSLTLRMAEKIKQQKPMMQWCLHVTGEKRRICINQNNTNDQTTFVLQNGMWRALEAE